MGAAHHRTIWFSGVICAAFLVVCAPFAAQAAMDYMPRLAPTSGWLIGQAALSDSANTRGAPLPCVALNQFENGFTIRFSGGGGRIAAMAIDFRQNAFGRGERYPVRISVDRAYARDFEGSAFDPGTLVIDTQADENLFKALQRGEIMIVGLGGSVAAFDLKGLPDGLARLESCYRPDAMPRQAQIPQQPQPDRQDQSAPGLHMIGGSGPSSAPQAMTSAPNVAVARSSLEQTLPESPASPPPSEEQAPLRIDAALNLAAQSVENTQSAPPPPSAQTAPAAVAENVWSAQKGEDIRTVLSRWSRQAGVNLVWTAKQAGNIENDFRREGPFEDAVRAFLAQSGKDMSARLQDGENFSGNKASGDSGDSAPIRLSPRADNSTPPPRGFELIAPASGRSDFPPVTAEQSAGSQGLWTAAAGADLRDTLAQWSRRVGVDLVWQSPAVFSVPVDISLGNGYESAVGEILKRSTTGNLRPVGELRRDSGSGRSALVIRVEGNS